MQGHYRKSSFIADKLEIAKKIKSQSSNMTTIRNIKLESLIEIENCKLDHKENNIYLLVEQPKRIPNKPRLNIKLDVEGLKEERQKLKKYLSELVNYLTKTKMQVSTLEAEIKRLRPFEVQYEKEMESQEKAGTVADPANGFMTTHDTRMAKIHRRQITDLKVLLAERDAEIARLRKIPANGILTELEIERQHLIEETIRLKAQLFGKTVLRQHQVLDGEVVRLLKEENYKLKGQLRLIEQELAVSKAKKSIFKRQNETLRKYLYAITKQLEARLYEIYRLQHYNKNLLVKKANHLRLIQEGKDREYLYKLSRELYYCKRIKKYLEGICQNLQSYLMALKEKYRQSVQAEAKLQYHLDSQINSYKYQLEQAQEYLNSFKENYLKMPSLRDYNRKNTLFEKTNEEAAGQSTVAITSQAHNFWTTKKITVPLQKLRVEIQHLKSTALRLGLTWYYILEQPEYSPPYFCKLLYTQPFNFPTYNAEKLTRYLFYDTISYTSQNSPGDYLCRLIKTLTPYSYLSAEYIEKLYNQWITVSGFHYYKMMKRLKELQLRHQYTRIEEVESLLEIVYVKYPKKMLSYLIRSFATSTYQYDGLVSVQKVIEMVQQGRLKAIYLENTSN